MDYPIVIVRAFRSRPCQRVAIRATGGLVYCANPDFLDAVKLGESLPVGFPEADVFAFDAAAFADLVAEWDRSGSTERSSWQRLRLFRPAGAFAT